MFYLCGTYRHSVQRYTKQRRFKYLCFFPVQSLSVSNSFLSFLFIYFIYRSICNDTLDHCLHQHHSVEFYMKYNSYCLNKLHAQTAIRWSIVYMMHFKSSREYCLKKTWHLIPSYLALEFRLTACQPHEKFEPIEKFVSTTAFELKEKLAKKSK